LKHNQKPSKYVLSKLFSAYLSLSTSISFVRTNEINLKHRLLDVFSLFSQVLQDSL